MTAKDYLSQYKYLDAEISLKQEKKKRLEEIAESTSSPSYPGGSGISDKVGKGAVNIVDIQKEIDIMIERLCFKNSPNTGVALVGVSASSG